MRGSRTVGVEAICGLPFSPAAGRAAALAISTTLIANKAFRVNNSGSLMVNSSNISSLSAQPSLSFPLLVPWLLPFPLIPLLPILSHDSSPLLPDCGQCSSSENLRTKLSHLVSFMSNTTLNFENHTTNVRGT